MRYKTRRIAKLYGGCADLRDYEVENAIKGNCALRVIFKDEYMTLTPDQLAKPDVKYPKPIPSRLTPGQFYKLRGYKWNPDYIEKLPLEEEIEKDERELSVRESILASPPPEGWFEKTRKAIFK